MALEEVTEALASEVFDARVESVARFVRDVDRPLDRRSNTFEPEDLRGHYLIEYGQKKPT